MTFGDVEARTVKMPGNGHWEGLIMRKRDSIAFSLLELATAMAVLMVLTAIAIPMVATAQHKAKRSEAHVNVNGIEQAIVAYETALDAWPMNGAPNLNPWGVIGKKALPWNTSVQDWKDVGWRPDGGSSYCHYAYWDTIVDLQITVIAQCDVDGDRTKYDFEESMWMTGDGAGIWRYQWEGCQPPSGVPVPVDCY